jgi:hypothetical protein
MTQVKDNIAKLIPFVKKVTGKTKSKALIDMARMLNSALLEAGINLDAYIEDYTKDEIFDPGCLLGNHDSIFDFVKNPYKEFAKVMFESRPVGLGTPQAMVGEGEFMALFCSPRVGIAKKKDGGDITVDGKKVELKGGQLRFFSPTKISGIRVQQHAKQISPTYGILPNRAGNGTNSKITDYQPWGNCMGTRLTPGGKPKKDPRSIAQHWIEQFSVLGVDRSCEYLAELCNVIVECEKGDFVVCFDSDKKFNQVALQHLLVKKLFRHMVKKWDAFTQVTDGRIISITDDLVLFDTLIDTGKLVMDGCYLRSNQHTTVGLYVNFP